MAFDQPVHSLPIPPTFEALYGQWIALTGKTKGEPLLEFVAWVETTLGQKICDIGTDEDMERLRQAFSARAGDGVGEMLWEGLEGGP